MSQHESGPLCCLCGQKLALKEAAEPQAPCPSVGVPRAAKSQFSGIPTPHPSPGRSRHTSHTHATHTQASGFTLILSFFPFCQKGPKRFYQVNKSDVFYFYDCIQTVRPKLFSQILAESCDFPAQLAKFLFNKHNHLCSTYLLLIQN